MNVRKLYLGAVLLCCLFVFSGTSYASVTEPDNAISAEKSSLPSFFDARELNIVPPVRDQGSSESCWAFAAVSAMEIDAVKQGLLSAEEADFSEAHLVWFTFTPAEGEDILSGESYISSGSPYLTRGNWTRATGTLARLSGTVREKDFPFDASSDNFAAMGNYDEAARYLFDDILLDETAVLASTQEVKEWITRHGSCTAMMYYKSTYENAQTSAYYYFGSSSNVNHMVTLVGWNDAYSAENFKDDPEQDGAWIVRDSRGESRHDSGYFYVSYADASLSTFAGYAVRSAAEPVHCYTYNAAGLSPCFRHSNGVSVANVFCAERTEELSALSFYTVDPDTRVDVDVFLQPELSRQDPTTGIRVFSASHSYSNAGFHTLSLPQGVALSPEMTFSVALTYSAPGGTVTVPVEYCNTSYNGCSYTGAPGQSLCFLFDKTDNWCDAQDMNYGNFYINAYTVGIPSLPKGTNCSAFFSKLLSFLQKVIAALRTLS